MTTAVQDSKPLRILRPRQVEQKVGVRSTKLNEMVKAGEFTPVRIGKRAIGFYEHEIDAWLASRPRVAA